MEIVKLESTMRYQSIMDTEKIYRYSLTRIWDETLPKITYIMLNPSVADHLKGDPTLNKCLNYAIDQGYGSIEVVNLFAYRSTDPDQLKRVHNPIGFDNDQFIMNAVKNAKTIVLAWGGENGKLMNRDKAVLGLLKDYKNKIKCFEDFTNKKKPQHPLTLKNGFILIDYPFENKSSGTKTVDTPLEQKNNLNTEWEHLNHIELNRFAKELAIRKLTGFGLGLKCIDNDLLVKIPSGGNLRIQVRSIRSTTKYVLLPKARFNAEDNHLYLLLIIFTKGKQPEFYFIPATVFKKPNDLFKDRDHYDVPEYGMNVSNKNMSLLRPYELENMVKSIIL